jgi:inhibitor of KinA
MGPLRISPSGDSALLVEYPARIDPAISARVIALADRVEAAYQGRLRDLVVGYCSLTVYFDPLGTDVDALGAAILQMEGELADVQAIAGRLVHVDVCYGGEYGPDLADVAAYAHGSEEDVVSLHTGVTYRVYMLGFVPGFAYMATVHPRLALPRRSTPRRRVAAGSVAIAAGQTGIYPSDTPGGWHIIGRTHLAPYDPSRAEPFAFRPGDEVAFHAVDRAAFDRLAS